MSAATEAGRAAARAPRASVLDRVLGAVPLLTVFVWLCLVYAVEAWIHGTPWLFTDELEWTQFARSIADTGHAARRGAPYSFKSIYSYLIAPAWLLHDSGAAYAAVKYIGTILMASAALPAYGLARTFVTPRAALFAAAATAAIPALVYSSFVIPEVLAYPYAALCFFLIARALLTRGRWWIGGAIVASLVSPLVKGELGATIPSAFALAAVLVVWSSERSRAWRARWSAWDWTGFLVLVLGALVFVSAYLGHQSYTWLLGSGYYKQRSWTYGLWAAGALTIGVGVLPVVATIATLVRGRREERTPELTVFRSLAFAGFVTFGLYTGIKAGYLSAYFETRIEERNLIYVAPLLFVGTAVALGRRAASLAGLAAGAALALYLVLRTPYRMDIQFYSDAPGLAILQQGNRYLGWTPTTAKVVLLLLLGISVAVVLALRDARLPARAAASVAAAAAIGVICWNVVGEAAASDGANGSARVFRNTVARPLDWLDRTTGGAPTLYLGQHVTDQNSFYLLEFWNRSVRYVWSLDGTAPGPGPTLTPDLASRDGTLTPDPGVRYVVADEGVSVVGEPLARHKRIAGGGESYWRLYAVKPPLRLRSSVTSRDPDGWIGSHGEYNQYSTPGRVRGYAVVSVSRREWGGPDVPGHVRIAVGPLVIGDDRQPALARETQARTWTVNRLQRKIFYIPAPPPPYRIQVEISPTFQPSVLDPKNYGDARQLGAVVHYGWVAKPPKRHR